MTSTTRGATTSTTTRRRRPARVGVPAPIGHGFNLLYAGDGRSRRSRRFFQRQYALAQSPPADLEGALVLAQELLNTYKVKGTVASVDADDAPRRRRSRCSPCPRARAPPRRADLTWRKIDLARLDPAPRPGPRAHAKVASARVLRDRRDPLIDPLRRPPALPQPGLASPLPRHARRPPAPTELGVGRRPVNWRSPGAAPRLSVCHALPRGTRVVTAPHAPPPAR